MDVSGFGLRRLRITDVADLRSRREVQRHGPGRVPDGVDIHLLPIPDLGPDELNEDGEAPHEHAFRRLLEDKPDDEPVSDAASRYMVDEYSRFPTYNGAQMQSYLDDLKSKHMNIVRVWCFEDQSGLSFSGNTWNDGRPVGSS